jgi:CRP/FNR family cyclic AMP-dependent transcriptional regulator
MRLSRRTNNELLTALAGLPTLVDCPASELRHLVDVGRTVTLPADWPLISEGTPGDTCYIILSGEAEVIIGSTTAATLGAGALVGEVGLLDARLRTASVVTRRPLKVLCLTSGELRRILDREPHLAEALLTDYRRRAAAH